MGKRTGPTNPYLKNLIEVLRKKSFELNSPIWLTVAKKLEKPRRKRVEVNLSKIERYCSANEVIVVPGKVLASGNLTKPLTIAAWRFSTQAKEKIKKAKGKALTIQELLEKNPKGKNVRLMC
jgi:large subunit ribosomal protein L18e